METLTDILFFSFFHDSIFFFSFLTRASLLFDATSVRLITEALKLLGLLFTFLYLMIKTYINELLRYYYS